MAVERGMRERRGGRGAGGGEMEGRAGDGGSRRGGHRRGGGGWRQGEDSGVGVVERREQWPQGGGVGAAGGLEVAEKARGWVVGAMGEVEWRRIWDIRRCYIRCGTGIEDARGERAAREFEAKAAYQPRDGRLHQAVCPMVNSGTMNKSLAAK
ncbi:hypothetical protein CYMTET_12690 [Cymbomonas tetramitiformis]|uniref:Uncharacterized protein n=1 Tax=Cymbomonas tetramitiformis TaxID=36881 RepID=A0AAE0GK63_9CHLO|nr:hypothetical protein CYMTET_12690 [Cymbomonas tetramitiformis]